MVGPRATTPAAVAFTIVRLPVTAVAFVGTATLVAPTPMTPLTAKVRTVPAVNLPVRPLLVGLPLVSVGRVSRIRVGAVAWYVEAGGVTTMPVTALASSVTAVCARARSEEHTSELQSRQ